MKVLSYDSWLSEFGDSVEQDYQNLHEEYGDALTCLLSQYKEQRYQEHCESLPLNDPKTTKLEKQQQRVATLLGVLRRNIERKADK